MPKPIIGLTTERCLTALDEPQRRAEGMLTTYIQAVRRAGGLPILIPLSLDEADLRELYPRLQGVLIPGGGDIAPRTFAAERHPRTSEVDEARDQIELELVRCTVGDGKPLLGICRGAQMMNVALGGTLYQDLPTELPGSIRHVAPRHAPKDHLMHSVKVEEESRLARILGAPMVEVNSRHHQALKDIAPGLEVTARAPDGVIEAVEIPAHPFALGVQWHPENFPDRSDMRAIFELFVGAALNCR